MKGVRSFFTVILARLTIPVTRVQAALRVGSPYLPALLFATVVYSSPTLPEYRGAEALIVALELLMLVHRAILPPCTFLEFGKALQGCSSWQQWRDGEDLTRSC